MDMRKRIRILALLFGVLVALFAARVSAQDQDIRVNQDSADPRRDQNEPTIAYNPLNSNHLLAGSNYFTPEHLFSRVAYYRSTVAGIGHCGELHARVSGSGSQPEDSWYRCCNHTGTDHP